MESEEGEGRGWRVRRPEKNNSRVAYQGDTSHFFGIGISRYQIQPVSVFFGRYYRGFGKISSFMVWLSKNI